MSVKNRMTGLEFLHAVKPRETDGLKVYPSKKDVFEALFATRGTHLSKNDISAMPQLKEVAHLRGRKAEMRIRSYEMSPDSYQGLEPKDSHYMEVALSAYLNAGGELKTFARDLDDHREEFDLKNQNFNLMMRQTGYTVGLSA